MNVIDMIWVKRQKWAAEGNKRPPNAIIMPPKEYLEFQKYLAEIESNSSLPLTFLRDMQIFSSTGTTEIKIGIII